MRWVLFVALAACATQNSNDPEGGPNQPPDENGPGGTDDSSTPECTPVDYYLDADHDGFGAGDLLSACDPVDAADVDGDCDDENAEVHPDQPDVCNGVDDDCDLDFDEDAATAEYFVDDDGDGYGTTDSPSVESCAPAIGYADVAGDCDDANSAVSPGLDEDWTDGIDDNCDGILETETPVAVAEATGNPWDAPTVDTTELRILGAYGPGPGGTTEVIHDVPEAVVLVLSSGNAVDWIVTETYPGTIQRILIAGGGGGSTVSGPKSASVDSRPSWSFAYDYDDLSARTLIEDAEIGTGLHLTSFHGAYGSPSFTVSPDTNWMDTSAYPDCSKKATGTTGGEPDVGALDPVACANVLEDDHICVTGTAAGTIVAYGLDSDESCTTLASSSAFTANGRPSIAWSDEWIYACTADDGMLQRLSLLTGVVEKTFLYCSGVASLDGQLYVVDAFGDVPVYDTWENAQCGSPTFYTDRTSNTRIAIHDGILYSTWHSTDEFEWQELGGSESGTSVLEDYDGWIQGIDVTEDGWFVAITEGGINWYDLGGHALGDIPVSTGIVGYGLGCAVQ